MGKISQNHTRFFCHACNKNHPDSAGLSKLHFDVEGEDIELTLCQLQLFKYNEKFSKSFITEAVSLKAMVSIKAKINKAEAIGDDTFKMRVDFVLLAFSSSTLHKQLISDELLEKHGIGQLFYDSCFEMGDGDQVIRAIIQAAQNDFWLDVQLRRAVPHLYEQWKTM